MFAKLGNGTVRDLTIDMDTVYTHPSTKQCNYSYVHPREVQCNVQSLIQAKSEIAIGNYIGNGASTRTINVGFTPRAVITMAGGCFSSDVSLGGEGGLAITGFPSSFSTICQDTTGTEINGSYRTSRPEVSITTNGFIVRYQDVPLGSNCPDTWYNYIAFK